MAGRESRQVAGSNRNSILARVIERANFDFARTIRHARGVEEVLAIREEGRSEVANFFLVNLCDRRRFSPGCGHAVDWAKVLFAEQDGAIFTVPEGGCVRYPCSRVLLDSTVYLRTSFPKQGNEFRCIMATARFSSRSG